MENFKFIAGQASSINQYKNTRSKLLKCCANVYFNKQCLAKKIIPNYAELKFLNTSPSAQLTSKKAQTTRIKKSPDTHTHTHIYIYIYIYKSLYKINVVLLTDV